MLAKLAVNLVLFYRYFISPLTPPRCRFIPTCSEYAIQAIHEHGFLLGTAKSVYRILRCNPLCKGGYDPVIRGNNGK